MSLQERCRQLRSSLGLSSREMAAHLDISDSLWGHYETGFREPSAETHQRLRKLGFSIDWLLSGEDSMRVQGAYHADGDAPRLAHLVSDLQQGLETPAGWRLMLWSELLSKLGSQSSGMSLAEIHAVLNTQVDTVMLRHELKQLQFEGLVAETKGRYYLIRLRKDCGESERELRTLLLIRKFLVTHLPAMKAGGRGRRMIDHDESVASGLGVVQARELLTQIDGWLNKAPEAGSHLKGDRIELIVSVVVRPAKE